MRKILLLGVSSLLAVSAYSQAIPSYLLENDAAHRYLTEVSYKSDDYTYTKITDYCDPKPYQWYKYGGYRKDQPNPVPLTWSAGKDVVRQRIEVSEDEGFSSFETYNVNKDASSFDLYNLIPGRTYYYRVIALKQDNNEATLGQGAFRTTGTLRMLKIDNVFNVRDMGGWTGLGGKPIKYGKLIRGSRLNNNGSSVKIITQDGIEELRRAGIKAELDLRDQQDAAYASSSFLGSDIPIVNINSAYRSRIATFADAPQSIMGIQKIINWFRQDMPVYFHCSVGADRTGTVAYLIGALCGMSEDALCKEFELTSFSADSIVTSGRQEDLRRRRTYDGRFDDNDNPASYRFADMVDKIKSFPGSTLQRKVYWHLSTGVQGTKISADDLAFLVKYLTDYNLLSNVECDVEALELERGETHQINVKLIPEDAEVEEIIYKTSSPQIATVSEDGLVTAVSGGSAVITVSADGINKVIPIKVPITPESVANMSLENEIVNRFVNEVHYDAQDYSVSLIEKYDTVKASYLRDMPKAARVEWNVDPEVVKQSLIVSEDENFDKVVLETETNVKYGYWNIRNLMPQRLYYFKLLSTYSDNSTIEALSSAFMTTGTVNMVKADGTFNVRDMGGWTGLDGYKVRYGKLIRGARLKNNSDLQGKVIITQEGIDNIRSMGVSAELDLRSDEETDNARSALGARVVKFQRIADANTCLGANITEGDAYIKALNTIIGWLKDGRSVYVSSTLGADRVGALAFLVNGLLGVDEDGLSKDYEISSFSEDNLTDVIRKRTDSQFVAMVNAIKALEGENLQKKIYGYFKNGVNGTSVNAEDLDWFINFMLQREDDPYTKVVIPHKNAQDGRIFNILGQEVINPGKGLYIKDGKKYME